MIKILCKYKFWVSLYTRRKGRLHNFRKHSLSKLRTLRTGFTWESVQTLHPSQRLFPHRFRIKVQEVALWCLEGVHQPAFASRDLSQRTTPFPSLGHVPDHFGHEIKGVVLGVFARECGWRLGLGHIDVLIPDDRGCSNICLFQLFSIKNVGL